MIGDHEAGLSLTDDIQFFVGRFRPAGRETTHKDKESTVLPQARRA
jgi:hypothetical protein